jgi:hypothetical protein
VKGVNLTRSSPTPVEVSSASNTATQTQLGVSGRRAQDHQFTGQHPCSWAAFSIHRKCI